MGETTNLNGFFTPSTVVIVEVIFSCQTATPCSSWKWKMVGELNGNEPIGDTPILHWTMMMGRRVNSKKNMFLIQTARKARCGDV